MLDIKVGDVFRYERNIGPCGTTMRTTPSLSVNGHKGGKYIRSDQLKDALAVVYGFYGSGGVEILIARGPHAGCYAGFRLGFFNPERDGDRQCWVPYTGELTDDDRLAIVKAKIAGALHG